MGRRRRACVAAARRPVSACEARVFGVSASRRWYQEFTSVTMVTCTPDTARSALPARNPVGSRCTPSWRCWHSSVRSPSRRPRTRWWMPRHPLPIGSCRNGKCLNVLNVSVSSRDAWVSQTTGNLVCSALQGGTMRVSELIYRIQVACGVSAKVILVTLQKEQGLTTSDAPSDWNLQAAMGASCPDTAPCDPAYSGVGPQIVQGVRQIKIYKAGRFAMQPGVRHSLQAGASVTAARATATATSTTTTRAGLAPQQPTPVAFTASTGTSISSQQVLAIT
jgi:hypothetical protein